MRTFLAAILLVSTLTVLSPAQTTPRAELFGGYSFLRVDANPFNNFNLHGWQTSATVNATRWLGFTANFGGNYGNPEVVSGFNLRFNAHTFLFGPTFSYRNKSRVTPFTHALFGVARGNGSVPLGITPGSVSLTDTSFAMAAGGGLDVHLNKIMATRLAQVDWVHTRLFGSTQNHVRVTTGLLFTF